MEDKTPERDVATLFVITFTIMIIHNPLLVKTMGDFLSGKRPGAGNAV